jgi:hypothetical protein
MRCWIRCVATTLCVSACAAAGGAGLGGLLDDLAPGYRRKAPASGEAELGRRLLGDQVETNACFVGREAAAPLASWSRGAVAYTSAFDARLTADFGATVQAEATTGPRSAVSVTLGDVEIVRLDSLFFDPAGGCAQVVDSADYLRGREATVLTRALRAGSIEITKSSAGGVGLRVNTARVGGSIGSETERTTTWQGTRLFFADYPERVVVRRAEARERTVAVGQHVDLLACGFTLRAVQPEGWEGDVSCQGGRTGALRANLGNFATWSSAPGVSYSARVRTAGVARGVVDLFQFTVTSR